MSSWSRTIFVPLSILWAKKPVRALPDGARRAASCFTARPAAIRRPRRARPGARSSPASTAALKAGERAARAPRALRARAVDRAAAWMIERFAGSDGLSAILPAMSNAALALSCLGHREDHPLMREALAALDGLLLDGRGRRAAHAAVPLAGVGHGPRRPRAGAGRRLPAPSDPAAARGPASWLLAKQTRRPGDWARRNPAPPGGWYFEHRNELYPDVDDTCMALMVLRQARADGARGEAGARPIARGLTWMLGMQNRDGGWAHFDRDNDKAWLTQVPFADHNAMIDPSTADITGRVLECLGYFPASAPATRWSRARWSSCAATSDATAPGTAAGASTTSTAPGRCCAGWPASART